MKGTYTKCKKGRSHTRTRTSTHLADQGKGGHAGTTDLLTRLILWFGLPIVCNSDTLIFSAMSGEQLATRYGASSGLFLLIFFPTCFSSFSFSSSFYCSCLVALVLPLLYPFRLSFPGRSTCVPPSPLFLSHFASRSSCCYHLCRVRCISAMQLPAIFGRSPLFRFLFICFRAFVTFFYYFLYIALV